MVGDPGPDQLYYASCRRLVVQMYAICGDAAAAGEAVQDAFVVALSKQRKLRQSTRGSGQLLRLRRRRTNTESRNMNRVSQSQWTFLSNHGHVLVALAVEPDARMRDVADAVGITERAVQQIVHDLVEQGYLRKSKVGRRNRYAVVRRASFRHDLESELTIGAFLDLLVPRAAGRRTSRRSALTVSGG